MDYQTVRMLSELDNVFYQANHASFSATRSHAWDGWQRVATSFARSPRTVLDVACGNLRFKSFLAACGLAPHANYYAIDSCAELVPPNEDVSFQNLDIIARLAEGTLGQSITAPPCDLVACFGFMHHVPTTALRMRLLETLIGKTAPQGLAALSFWQFARDKAAREKAMHTTERACAELGMLLDKGDYLLGWNNVEGAYRYCHSFSDDEMDSFISAVDGRASLVDRFRADGRTGEMNGYLVFRKR